MTRENLFFNRHSFPFSPNPDDHMTDYPEPPPLLLTTLLLDPPGSRTARQLGKTQVSSLLRFFFHGEIIVWRNFSEPLYPVARVGLHEIEFTPNSPFKKDADLGEIAANSKLKLAVSLAEHASRYSWIILADNDILALRNWDHLFENQKADLLVSRHSDGSPDTGIFAIRSSQYERFLHAWNSTESSSANFLHEIVESGNFTSSEFERGEVISAFADDSHIRDIMES
jgi:hypothetical protein